MCRGIGWLILLISVQLPAGYAAGDLKPWEQPGSKAGEEIAGPDGAPMVWVPAGEFIRGGCPGQAISLPQRNINLDGYWVQKTEVTVKQYRKFCDTTGRSMPPSPRWGWQDDHPIVNVSWEDAAAYAKWAGLALPTEAQWEKAARGTDGRNYPWGNEWDVNKCANQRSPAHQVEPVGSYPAGASPYGCLDMAGNVQEWCADVFPLDPRGQAYYTRAPADNPPGPFDKFARGFRVWRGGSFTIGMENTEYHCAYRSGQRPQGYSRGTGFRCVATPPAGVVATGPKAWEQLGSKAGQTIVGPDGGKMVWVPAGEFLMGMSDKEFNQAAGYFWGDKTAFMSSRPQRKVTLDGYWIQKHEVTAAQYRKFCERTGRDMPWTPPEGWLEDQAIENITWEEAAAYAEWTGLVLPTEAQWEKAARGCNGRWFPWGNQWDAAKCAHAVGKRFTDGLPVIGPRQPVGRYAADTSPYGCQDMAGNVGEYCADWFQADYYMKAPLKNPTGPEQGEKRVFRGGSWMAGFPSFFFAATRETCNPQSVMTATGFRCAWKP